MKAVRTFATMLVALVLFAAPAVADAQVFDDDITGLSAFSKSSEMSSKLKKAITGCTWSNGEITVKFYDHNAGVQKGSDGRIEFSYRVISENTVSVSAFEYGGEFTLKYTAKGRPYLVDEFGTKFYKKK